MKKKILLPLILVSLLLGACKQDKTSSIVSSFSSSESVTSSLSSAPESSSLLSSSSSNISSSSFNTSVYSDSSTSSMTSSSNNPVSSSSSVVSSSSEPKKEVNIVLTNLTDNYVRVSNVTEKGFPGDLGTFEVKVNSKFEIVNCTAKGSKGENVEVSLIAENKYSFVIPNDGIVNVSFVTEAKVVYSKIYVKDENNFILSVEQVVIRANQDPEYVALGYTFDEEIPYFNVPEGSRIRITLDNPSKYSDIGLIFNEQDLKPDISGYININLKDYSGPFLIETYGTVIQNELVAVNSDHLTIKFYKEVELKNEISTIGVFETFYIKVTSTDVDAYIPNKLTYSYENTAGNTSTYDITDILTYNENGYYTGKHNSPSVPTLNGITYTITEDDLNKFVDEPFVGEYLAFNLFTYNNYSFTSFNNSVFRFSGSGKVTYGSKTLTINCFETDENGYVVLKDREEATLTRLYYKNDVIFAGNNSSSSASGESLISSPFSPSGMNGISDDVFAFKMLPNSDREDYKLYASTFRFENTIYSIATVYYQDEYYNGAFAERLVGGSQGVRNKYTGITVDMVYGDHIIDNQAIYHVLDENNNVVLSVGFKSDGGIENRTFLPDYGGCYTCGEDKLYLMEDQALYKGKIYRAVLENNILTLTSTAADYTMELDFANKTFIVTNSEERNLVLGPFAGKAFRMYWNAYRLTESVGSHESYSFYIEFDEEEPLMSCVATIMYYADMSNYGSGDQYFAKNVDVLYIYNEATKTFTATINGYGNVMTSVTFHYNDSNPNSPQITFEASELDAAGKNIISNTVICDLIK